MTKPITAGDIAEKYSRFFERKERLNHTNFWCLTDDAPEKLKDLVREAHDGMMPDDWRYEFIMDAFCALREAEDLEDYELPYFHKFTNWLASHANRVAYTNEALRNAPVQDITCAIEDGMILEFYEVMSYVQDFIRDEMMCDNCAETMDTLFAHAEGDFCEDCLAEYQRIEAEDETCAA